MGGGDGWILTLYKCSSQPVETAFQGRRQDPSRLHLACLSVWLPGAQPPSPVPSVIAVTDDKSGPRGKTPEYQSFSRGELPNGA